MTMPLSIVVSVAPLMRDALAATLARVGRVDDLADGADGGPAVLGWRLADAVVVDSAEEAAEFESFARECGIPLLHVVVAEERLRVFRSDEWEDLPYEGDPMAAIRNVLVSGICGPSSRGNGGAPLVRTDRHREETC